MSIKPAEKQEEEPQETNRARIERQYKAHREMQGDPVPEQARAGTSPENPEYLPENLNKQAPEGKVPPGTAVPAGSKQAVEEEETSRQRAEQHKAEQHRAEQHRKH